MPDSIFDTIFNTVGYSAPRNLSGALTAQSVLELNVHVALLVEHECGAEALAQRFDGAVVTLDMDRCQIWIGVRHLVIYPSRGLTDFAINKKDKCNK